MGRADFLKTVEPLTGIEKLLAVVACLRDPKDGCPWDLKQTHASLKPFLLEESYETLEAIDLNSPQALREELGDVLLQVALHAQIAQDTDSFHFMDVAQGIADKLIHRHPHVFGETTTVDTPEAVTQQWQQIKAAEKAQKGETLPTSILEGVPKNLPALSRALETSKRAVKVGFEWPSFESLWECVMSEYAEFKHEVDSAQDFSRLEDEMGDILFASVNLARQFKIDPEVALSRAVHKFTLRFQAMESLAGERPLESLDFETWDALWNQAKTAVAPTLK